MDESTIQKIESYLESFGSTTPELHEYLTLRKAEFTPASREFTYNGTHFATTLRFVRAGEVKVIQSSATEFILWAFCHCWTSHSGLRLALEFEGENETKPPLSSSDGPLQLSAVCGLMRASMSEIVGISILEDGTNGVRAYRLRLKRDAAHALTRAPSDPTLEITVLAGRQRVMTFRGYVDGVLPLELQTEQFVELVGGDSLTGCRAQVSGLYNGLVNFDTSVLGFAAFLELRLLVSDELRQPQVDGLDAFLSRELTANRYDEFRGWLESRSSTLDSVGRLATMFVDALYPEHPMLPTAPFGFQNLAVAAENEVPIWMAVGSVRGMNVDGAVRIAPGVVVCGPEDLHVKLKQSSESERLLCRHWDNDAAHLVTFFSAQNAGETCLRGKAAISAAFESLNLAISDSAWLHADGKGSVASPVVDSRLQDAQLELDRWYHVHHIPTGTAHQYYSVNSKSTFTLELNDFAVMAVRQRLDVLFQRLRDPASDRPRSLVHLERAVSWFSRSRNSTTPSERFLCLWIAVEFLLMRNDAGGAEAIKDGISSRVARLMSRGDRTARRFWRNVAEEAYNARCEIVHEAKEDLEKIERLTPLLQQAVFDIVWHCALHAGQHAEFEHPRDVLDVSLPT